MTFSIAKKVNCYMSLSFAVTNMDTLNLVHRRIYPFFLVIGMILGIISFQIRQFKKLYEHIKNDKLVNQCMFLLSLLTS